MVSEFLNIIVLFLPGVVSEWYYLTLNDQKFEKGKSIIRALSFSIVILMFRGMLSISRGYGQLPIQDLFSGIGNVTKYILLASVLVVILPNVYIVITALINKTAKWSQNQQRQPDQNGGRYEE